MSVDGQSVVIEDIVARLHHTCIVIIDVAHIYPSPHTVSVESQPVLLQHAQIFLEEHYCLRVGVHSLRLALGQSERVEHEVGFALGSLH